MTTPIFFILLFTIIIIIVFSFSIIKSTKVHKEEIQEIQKNNMGDYLKWIIICCLYSLIRMLYESGGDIGMYYRPLEEFFMHFVIIVIVGCTGTTILLIFSITKFSKFSKNLIWVTSTLGTAILIGGMI